MRTTDAPAPWLTVVMPVHRGERWIGATLDSLVAQDESGLEVLLLDSSPDRATLDAVERYRDRLDLRVVELPDMSGWHAKTNHGVTMARADHVAILHQDDLWLPGRTAAVRRWIAAAPGAALHLAPTRIVGPDGEALGVWRCPLADGPVDAGSVIERLLVQNFVSVPAPVFRRSAWIGCGGMDTNLWYTCDWDVWLKLVEAGPVVYHDEINSAFRVHGSSLTMTGSRDLADFEAQMRIVLERHLPRLPERMRSRVGRTGRASIAVNTALASASRGDWRQAAAAALKLAALGPAGIRRYVRDSRIVERVVPRLRARRAGAF